MSTPRWSFCLLMVLLQCLPLVGQAPVPRTKETDKGESKVMAGLDKDLGRSRKTALDALAVARSQLLAGFEAAKERARADQEISNEALAELLLALNNGRAAFEEDGELPDTEVMGSAVAAFTAETERLKADLVQSYQKAEAVAKARPELENEFLGLVRTRKAIEGSSGAQLADLLAGLDPQPAEEASAGKSERRDKGAEKKKAAFTTARISLDIRSGYVGTLTVVATNRHGSQSTFDFDLSGRSEIPKGSGLESNANADHWRSLIKEKLASKGIIVKSPSQTVEVDPAHQRPSWTFELRP